MKNQAYQATSTDVENVLQNNSIAVANSNGKSFETMAEEIFDDLNFFLIEKASLNGNELDQQKVYANKEIVRQLCEMGILESHKLVATEAPAGLNAGNVSHVTVQLQLTRKDGTVMSEATMLSWIHTCLNCNTNNIEAQVTVAVAEKPVLVINMDGGLIQDMLASAPVRVIVLDGDVEGSQDETHSINDEDVLVADHTTINIDLDYTQSVVSQVESAADAEGQGGAPVQA